MPLQPTRRQFVSSAMATAAAITSLPRTLRAEHPPDRPIMLGEGDHRYQCLHDWGRIPDKIRYGLTHGVAVDRAQNVHVLHTSRKDSPSKDTVVVFDKEGNFLRSWGEQFFGTAHGFDLIVEDGREIFYITDMARGLFNSVLPTKVRSPRHFDRKDNLVVIPDLDAVVTLIDENNKIVAQLGDGFTTFAEVRALRSKPRDQFKPGKFVRPHDAAFAADGSIFVSEWVDVGRVTKLQRV
jgi:hypothetical protein